MRSMYTLVLLLLAAPVARADLNVSLVDSGGDSSATLAAGSFFDVFVELDLAPGQELWSGQFFLQDTTSSGLFTLVGIDLGTAAGWDSLDFDPSPVALDTSNPGYEYLAGDIGASASAGATSGRMLTLHMHIAAWAAPGVYALNLFDDPNDLLDPVFYDFATFNPVTTTFSSSYTVTVPQLVGVPAPGAAMLVATGLALVGIRSRRRRLS